MNCPICFYPLQIEKETIYPNHASYKCLNYKGKEDKSHYQKHYSADWTYNRYEERATVGIYQIVNFYYDRPEGKRFGCIKKYMNKKNALKMDDLKHHIIFRMNRTIPIPEESKFLDKIQTILLFS